MSSHDKDPGKVSYEEFCASGTTIFSSSYSGGDGRKRNWQRRTDSAIAAWQHDGFEGKPPLKLVLEALLDGVEDEEILFRR